MTAKTLYDKIWDAHLVKQRQDGTALIYIDRQLVHEVTSPQAFEALRLAKRKLWRADANLATPDHNVPSLKSERAGGVDGIVEDIAEAIEHIGRYGSGHTECIVADDDAAATQFFTDLDSAILLHNASTQYADGAEFGMGAEIGIATGRIHARGPVGAEQLTSYKYVVRGSGQVRP